MTDPKDLVEKEEETEGTTEDSEVLKLLFGDSAGTDYKNKTFGLYGDVDEETASTAVYTLIHFGNMPKPQLTADEAEEEGGFVSEPIKMFISTHGGSAHDLFAIYDIMRMVKENCDIETVGLGKVMSAGVLLLAAGTKGLRKIGRNCRVMIHPVAAASIGDLVDIENETKEIKVLQGQYVKELVENTNMTAPQIKRMIKKKVNIYISAKEAVDLGIADEII